MIMYIVIVYNLEWKECLVHTFGGEIPLVPVAVVKYTCLTVYIGPLGYYWIFETIGIPDGTYSVRLQDPVRTEPPWVPLEAFSRRGSLPYLDHSRNRGGPSVSKGVLLLQLESIKC